MTIRTLTLPKLYTIREGHRRLLRAARPIILPTTNRKSTWSTPPNLNQS